MDYGPAYLTNLNEGICIPDCMTELFLVTSLKDCQVHSLPRVIVGKL